MDYDFLFFWWKVYFKCFSFHYTSLLNNTSFFTVLFWMFLMFFDPLSSEMWRFSLYRVKFLNKVRTHRYTGNVHRKSNTVKKKNYKILKNKPMLHFKIFYCFVIVTMKSKIFIISFLSQGNPINITSLILALINNGLLSCWLVALWLNL